MKFLHLKESLDSELHFECISSVRISTSFWDIRILRQIIFRMLRIVATRALTTTAIRRMDPIQAIFVNKIRQYAADSAAAGGPG